MTDLLDSNVIIALCDLDHPYHSSAQAWIDANPGFAVCKSPLGSRANKSVLAILEAYEGYEFWPDDLSYAEAPLNRIRGHKQVTDAYLVALAVHHGGRLATFDKALVAVHPEAVLIP